MDQNETPQPSDSNLDPDKIVSGPSVHVTRALLYIVTLMLTSFVVWSLVAQVDVIVQARGRLEVQGEPVKLGPPEEGLVIEVPVEVGDHVVAGQPLLRLRSLRYTTEAVRIEAEIRAVEAEVERHRASAAASRSAATALGGELVIAANSSRILAEQEKTYRRLVEDGMAPALQAQNKERERIDAEGRQLRLEAERQRAQDEAADRERLALEALARLDGLRARLGEIRENEGQMTLTAPESGTITDLRVANPGSVIDTNLPAVTLAPDARPLLGSIMIPNSSMRGVREGASVRLRLDAFPYQDYGYVEGRLSRIEPAAEGDGRFHAWATLESTEMETLSLANLRPGLLLDALILIDRRSVADVAFRPFKRLGGPMTISE